MTRLSQTDYLTWRLQRNPVLKPTIVSIMMLDAEPDWDALVEAIDCCTRSVPELRARLVPSVLPLTAPRWEPDAAFDLSWHVQRASLVPRVDLNSVLEFARRYATEPFDPDRPLWRSTLLTGPDDSDGCALVLKIHHCLTDGVGGVRILAGLCDIEPSGRPRSTYPPPAQEHSGFRGSAAPRWPGFGAIQGGASWSVATALRALAHPLESARASAELATSLARLVRPITSTLSPVMINRGPARTLSAFQVPVDALARAAHANGCTMNDAFLTAVLCGLRRYHLQHDRPIQRLRVTMPISLRGADDPLGGNRISLSRFVVPADGNDASSLMRYVGAVVRDHLAERSVPHSAAVAAILNRVPIALIAAMLEHVDFVASDVPASRVPLYLAGARIERMFAFSPTLGTALNVTMTSYAGTCFVGVNVDTAAVPDTDTLTECLVNGFRAVLDLNKDRAAQR
ncbi:DUF1298 domain-containing protein [Nocardia cyriacigeorgica]|uniref:wax ester/triacylglycerol synthase domain-containing protein n=1 Tax=Nocardia cyriacigeorgica TaxID=135487 RepID=UPI001895DF8C|nr:wax ester/triacylglycerol synthase domain-containing protein [Nocardia cyriacigeorgica]MBF6514213.1 DUF1298 domain-containing protein [Nocardia cyriacigeorgica]